MPPLTPAPLPSTTYTWHAGDTVWSVCGQPALFRASGYGSAPALVAAVQLANPTILDWQAVPALTVIIVPSAMSISG